MAAGEFELLAIGVFYMKFFVDTADVAEIKDCPSSALGDMSKSWDNKASVGFGCANNMNIALMLADPGDVVAPPDLDPAMAARRSDMFDKYRKGQPTASTRSPDERGAVSTAVR